MSPGPMITNRTLAFFLAGLVLCSGAVAAGLWYLQDRGGQEPALAASTQPADRLRAIDSLADRGGEIAAPALRKLAGDSDKVVAVKAVQALRQVPGQAGLAMLEGVLADKTVQARVRAEAAAVLGRRKDADFRVLTGALADAEPLVRAGAARGLHALKEPRSVPALFQALSDGDQRVRKAAIDAIHQLVVHHFRYDPRMAPDRQRAQIEQIRQTLIRCKLL